MSTGPLGPNVFVPDFMGDPRLQFGISVLRKAFGEDGARWIATVPKHGYRFVAEVRSTTPSGTSAAASFSIAKNEPASAAASRSGTGKVWLAAGTVAAGLLVVLPLLMFGREPRTVAIKPSPALAVPLTAYPGFEDMPSLSRDGSRVAFSWNGPTLDNPDIYVKLAGPGEPMRLTTNPARDDSPAWSPDGRFVVFVRFRSPPVLPT